MECNNDNLDDDDDLFDEDDDDILSDDNRGEVRDGNGIFYEIYFTGFS